MAFSSFYDIPAALLDWELSVTGYLAEYKSLNKIHAKIVNQHSPNPDKPEMTND